MDNNLVISYIINNKKEFNKCLKLYEENTKLCNEVEELEAEINEVEKKIAGFEMRYNMFNIILLFTNQYKEQEKEKSELSEIIKQFDYIDSLTNENEIYCEVKKILPDAYSDYNEYKSNILKAAEINDGFLMTLDEKINNIKKDFCMDNINCSETFFINNINALKKEKHSISSKINRRNKKIETNNMKFSQLIKENNFLFLNNEIIF